MRSVVLWGILCGISAVAAEPALSQLDRDLARLKDDVRGMNIDREEGTAANAALASTTSKGRYYGLSVDDVSSKSVTRDTLRPAREKRNNRFMHGSFDPEFYNRLWHRKFLAKQGTNCCCRGCGEGKGATVKVPQPWRVSCTDVCSSGVFAAEAHSRSRGSDAGPLKCAEAEIDGCTRFNEESRLKFPESSVLEPMTKVSHLKAAEACGPGVARCVMVVNTQDSYMGDYLKVTASRSAVHRAFKKVFSGVWHGTARTGQHWGKTNILYPGDTGIFPLETDEVSLLLNVSAGRSNNFIDSDKGHSTCRISTKRKRGVCNTRMNFETGWSGVIQHTHHVQRGSVTLAWIIIE